MASNVANMKKAYDAEVLSEAQVIRGNTSGNWTSTLIRKYLRSYSLGPGPDQYGYGRSLNRYTRKDVETAWLTVPPAIRRERNSILQGYMATDSVEEFIEREAESRARSAAWDAAEDAVDLSLSSFSRGVDWMDTVRIRFAANELTPTQIAAVEKIPGWSWEIGVAYLRPEPGASRQTSDVAPAETSLKPTTERIPDCRRGSEV
jgi:hypothetical protein